MKKSKYFQQIGPQKGGFGFIAPKNELAVSYFETDRRDVQMTEFFELVVKVNKIIFVCRESNLDDWDGKEAW